MTANPELSEDSMTSELFSQIIGTGIGLVVAFFIIRALARRNS